MGEKDLKKNVEYVEKEKEQLLEKYRNKYLLIHEEQVVDSFDSYAKAAEGGIQQFGIEATFLVHFMTEQPPVNFVMGAIL